MTTYPTPTREQAGSLDDRVTYPLEITQWRTADGRARFVILRALSVQQRMDAERVATERRPAGEKGGAAEWWVNPWRLIIEEVRRGVATPPELPYSVVAGWNYAVVEHIYTTLHWISGTSQAAIDSALARVAGEPPPDVAEPAAPDSADDDPAGMGAAGGAAAEGEPDDTDDTADGGSD
jgi:hypothetical protein